MAGCLHWDCARGSSLAGKSTPPRLGLSALQPSGRPSREPVEPARTLDNGSLSRRSIRRDDPRLDRSGRHASSGLSRESRRDCVARPAAGLASSCPRLPECGSKAAMRRRALTDPDSGSSRPASSEADGTFHSENLVSNEADFQRPLPSLTERPCLGSRVRRGRVRAELQLHRRRPALARLHRRHPARQLRPAPALQGAVRAVGGSCRLRRRRCSRGKRPAGLTTATPRRRQSSRPTSAPPPSRKLYTRNLAAVSRHI